MAAASHGERVEARATAEPAPLRPAAAPGGAGLAQTMLALQRTAGNRAVAQMVARTVTFDECSSSQESRVLSAHNKANRMLNTALRKTNDYDGTDPAEVHTALAKHFNSTSTFVAGLVATNIRNLKSEMDWSFDPQYECQSEQDDSVLAWVPWCIPGADIEVYPLWFTKRDGTQRDLHSQASTFIHEWFHKYGCKLDVGYSHEDDYGEHSTFRQLLNADSFGEFIHDVTS